MSMISIGSGLVGGVLLLALGLGFIVLCLAKKETGPFKMLGYLIGSVIIAICGVLIAQKLVLRINECRKFCPMAKMMDCNKMMKRQQIMQNEMQQAK